MEKNIILEVLLALFLIIFSMFTGGKKTSEKNEYSLKLPEVIENHRGTPVVLSEEEKKFAVTTGTKIIKENYGTFTVTVISSGDDARLLHSPRVCYEAWGYLIYSEEIINITEQFKTVKMTVIKNNNKETLYYWFFNKNNKITSFSDLFMSSMKGEKNWSLVTVVCAGEDKDIKNTIIYIDKFLQGFI